MDFIDLDECVVKALELFSKKKLPKMTFDYKRPLVVGSGNAAVTGRIMFEDRDAVFADESNFIQKIEAAEVDGCVLVNASGGKHGPIIAKELQKRGIHITLITCNEKALAAKFCDKVYVTPKNPEPYTYNTSTYLGMIMSKTGEDPKTILKHIKEKIKPKIGDLSKYDSYFFILPDEFYNIRDMYLTKFDELFGPKISGRAFTVDQAEHAKTIVKSDTEMFVGVGHENKLFGKARINLELPKGAKHAAVAAIGYYFIGNIQKQNKPYYKEGIVKYTEDASKLFHQKIEAIVK